MTATFDAVGEPQRPGPSELALQVFAAATELPPDAQIPYARRACANDETVLANVLQMLELLAGSKQGSTLSRGVGAVAAALVTDPPWQIGDEIGPYRLIDKVGKGGMGVVYLAEHIELKRRVALKM